MLDSLDRIDRRILNILQEDATVTNVDLARQVGLAPASTLDRVRKLRREGYIRSTVALLEADKVGHHTIAFVSISLLQHGAEKLEAFRSHVENLPDVLECYHVSGESDFLLKVVARDIRAYEDFLLHRLTSVPGIGRIHTSFVLSTVKHGTKLPIADA